jgi:hypothetical protein
MPRSKTGRVEHKRLARVVIASLLPLLVEQSATHATAELTERLAGDEPGQPSIAFALALIIVMFVLPTGAGGLVRRVVGPLKTRRYTRAEP